MKEYRFYGHLDRTGLDMVSTLATYDILKKMMGRKLADKWVTDVACGAANSLFTGEQQS